MQFMSLSVMFVQDLVTKSVTGALIIIIMQHLTLREMRKFSGNNTVTIILNLSSTIISLLYSYS